MIIGASMAERIRLGEMEFNNGDPSGIEWFVETLDGWDSGSASSLTLTQRIRSAGAWRSADPQMTSKTVTLSGYVTCPDRQDLRDGLDSFLAAVTLDETALQVYEGNRRGWLTANVSRQGEVLIRPVGDAFSFSVQLAQADPRKFSPPHSWQTGPPSSSGGLSVPFTVPFSINATTVTGVVQIVNDGNATGPCTVRIAGPCVGPVVTHTDAAGNAAVVALANFSLGAGEFIDIDMEAETVLAQGQSERAQWLTSRGFSGFTPGLNSWAFAVTSGPSALMTVTATPARG